MGSAVFNLCFVIGIVAIMVPNPIKLNWWPMARDSVWYTVILIILAMFFGVSTPNYIDWWEALILHLCYYIYIAIMAYNKELFRFFSCGGNKGEPDSQLIQEELVEEQRLFSSPSRFRAGVLSLLMTNKSFLETAGTHMVTQIAGTVEEVFKRFDKDGNNTIDKSELISLFKELNCPDISDEDLNTVFKQLDADSSGTIDLAEFTVWFMASKQRILAEASACFDRIDIDKSGSLSPSEIATLIRVSFVVPPIFLFLFLFLYMSFIFNYHDFLPFFFSPSSCHHIPIISIPLLSFFSYLSSFSPHSTLHTVPQGHDRSRHIERGVGQGGA